MSAHRKYRLKKFGSSLDYDALFERQNGLCAICGEPDKVLVIDHCHAQQVVRGLLCYPCNSGLGMFADDPERLRRAVSYVRKPVNIRVRVQNWRTKSETKSAWVVQYSTNERDARGKHKRHIETYANESDAHYRAGQLRALTGIAK